MHKTYLLLIFLSMLVLPLQGVSVAADEPTDDLVTLINAALDHNPALLAILDQQQGAGHRIESADDLADPVLSFAFSNYPVDSYASDESPMTGNEVRLDQRLPYPGKLGSKKEMVARDAAWFQGQYEDARFELTRKIKDAYYMLYAVDRAIDTVTNNLVLLDDLARLAETRYQVGKAKQSDVLKIHLEKTSQRDRLIQLERQRVTVQGNLNSLANRPVDTAIRPPVKIEIRPLDPALDLETLKAGAESHRPQFAAWQAKVEQVKLQRELDRLDYKPDLNLWASYRFRDDNLPDQGTDFASVGFSFNLPFNRSRRAAAVASSESMVNQARNQFADFRSKVEFAIDDSWHAARHNYDLVELYRTGMVPQARQVYAAALSAYQVGKADFNELLSALLARDKFELELHRLVSEYLQAVARLEAASGVAIHVTNLDG